MRKLFFGLSLIAVLLAAGSCKPVSDMSVHVDTYDWDGTFLETIEARSLDVLYSPGGALVHVDNARHQETVVTYSLSLPGFESYYLSYTIGENGEAIKSLDEELVVLGHLVFLYAVLCPELSTDGTGFDIDVPFGPAVMSAIVQIRTDRRVFFLSLAGNDYYDSDGDMMPDWWEELNSLDPYDASGEHGAYGDPDGDGLANWQEYIYGTVPYGEFGYDTDGDGFSDSEEVSEGSDPLDPEDFPAGGGEGEGEGEGEPELIKVPDVTGMAEDAAIELLTELGLVIGDIDHYHSATLAGVVINQFPGPCNEVEPGSLIDLVVSLGPKPHYELRISVGGKGKVLPFSDGACTYPEGTVVGLEAIPAEGWAFDHWEGPVSEPDSASTSITMKSDHKVVAVFVEEDGEECIAVPDLVGMTQADAGRMLTAMGLVIGELDNFYSDTVPEGHVISQEPEPGTLVAPCSGVDVVISLGPHITTYELHISTEGHGNVSPFSAGMDTYPEGTVVEIEATPIQGWVFDHWEGDLAGNTNPTALVMNADYHVTVVFTEADGGEDGCSEWWPFYINCESRYDAIHSPDGWVPLDFAVCSNDPDNYYIAQSVNEDDYNIEIRSRQGSGYPNVERRVELDVPYTDVWGMAWGPAEHPGWLAMMHDNGGGQTHVMVIDATDGHVVENLFVDGEYHYMAFNEYGDGLLLFLAEELEAERLSVSTEGWD